MKKKEKRAYPAWTEQEKALVKRFEAAKKRKEPWIPHLRTCYEYTIPHRETFQLYSPGASRNTHIFDSTGGDALEVYANQLQARLMPPWRKFSKLEPGSEVMADGKGGGVDEAYKQQLQEKLDKQTDILFTYLNHSNMSTQVNEACLDVGISTGALTLESEVRDGELSLVFNAVPLAELVLEEGPNGLIETVWRERKVKGRNILRTWHGAEFKDGSKLKAKSEKAPDKDFDFIEGVIYDPDEDWYFGVAIEKSSKELVWREEYEISPWIVFRANVIPGEIYGRGVVQKALPTILTANKVVEYVLRNAGLAVAGAWTSKDTSVINPYTMNISPGTVIPVRSNSSADPTLRALERSGDFSVGELVLDDLRKSIKTAMKNNNRRPDGPVRSAYEIALDNMEDVEQNGTSYGRLQTELVARVIRRAVSILRDEGKMADIKVDGRQVTLKHTSPLARAQDSEDLAALQQFQETVAPLGQEVVAMRVKLEEIPAFVAEKTGFPAKLMRDEGETEELKAMIAQMVAQMVAQSSEQAGAAPPPPAQ